GLADGLDLLRLLVGDGNLELFFEFHDELDDVEGVGAHVFDERGGARHLFLVDAEILADDVDHALFNGCHGKSSKAEAGRPAFRRNRCGAPPHYVYLPQPTSIRQGNLRLAQAGRAREAAAAGRRRKPIAPKEKRTEARAWLARKRRRARTTKLVNPSLL